MAAAPASRERERSVGGQKVAVGRIELNQPLRFSLDESFDVGQDTGSPVIDEYDDKMPFKFSGTLRKVDIDLGPNQLTPSSEASLSSARSTSHITCSEGHGADALSHRPAAMPPGVRRGAGASLPSSLIYPARERLTATWRRNREATAERVAAS
jgi:hypothetical protein